MTFFVPCNKQKWTKGSTRVEIIPFSATSSRSPKKKNTTHTVTVSVNTGVCGQGLCVLFGVATDVSAIIVVNFHAIPTLDQQNDQDVG